MRIIDWSSDVCSSDLSYRRVPDVGAGLDAGHPLQGRIDVVLDGVVAADAEIGDERLGDGIRRALVVLEVHAPAVAPVVEVDASRWRPVERVVQSRRRRQADAAVETWDGYRPVVTCGSVLVVSSPTRPPPNQQHDPD